MRRAMLVAVLAGAIAISEMSAGAQARPGRAAVSSDTSYVFSTATSKFSPPSNNQGWWSSNSGNSNFNDNYFTGRNPGQLIHDYFTFDISGFGNNCALGRSAYLTVPRGAGFTTGAPVLTLGLYDVSTDPFRLSQKANNPNSLIYDDLGSGKSYGNFLLPTLAGAPFMLDLNGVGLAAINQAHLDGQQFFSIGGALVKPPPISTVYLFGSTGGTAVTLTVIVPKICRA